MNFLLPAMLLFASAPLPWTDLTIGDQLVLTEKVTLGEAGPSFPAGTRLEYQAMDPLDIAGAPVVYLSFIQPNCEHPEWESGIEIVLPKNNPESSSVGVEIERGCHWGIYVEQKDLFQPSLFGIPENRKAHVQGTRATKNED